MAGITDANTNGMLYVTSVGRLKANIPVKCIDQIPMPMANAPLVSQTTRDRPCAAVTRPATSSAVYEAITATRYESATSRKSYEAANSISAWFIRSLSNLYQRSCKIMVLLISSCIECHQYLDRANSGRREDSSRTLSFCISCQTTLEQPHNRRKDFCR